MVYTVFTHACSHVAPAFLYSSLRTVLRYIYSGRSNHGQDEDIKLHYIQEGKKNKQKNYTANISVPVLTLTTFSLRRSPVCLEGKAYESFKNKMDGSVMTV